MKCYGNIDLAIKKEFEVKEGTNFMRNKMYMYLLMDEKTL